MQAPPRQRRRSAKIQLVHSDAAQEGLDAKVPSRCVLVIHPDRAKRDELIANLCASFSTLAASGPKEALALLDEHDADLILSDGGFCTRAFLDGVASRGLSGRCVFLASPACVNRLIDGFASGHAFGIVYEADLRSTLIPELNRIIYPRMVRRHELDEIHLKARVAGQDIECTAVDISNYGCAIEFYLASEMEPTLPGTVLESIVLEGEDGVLLAGVSGVVRHLEVLSTEQTPPGQWQAFRAGIEFVPTALQRPTPPIDESLTRDPAQIVALLQAALKEGGPGISVRTGNRDRIATLSSAPRLERGDSRIAVGLTAHEPLSVGDVCHCVFELGGTQHTFWAAIAEIMEHDQRIEAALYLPRVIESRRYRNTQRFRPLSDQPVGLRIVSPFQMNALRCRALDITASGAAFEIDGSADLFPIGTVIPDFVLEFPHRKVFTARAIVRSLHARESTTPGKLKCGVELLDLSPARRAELADSIVRCVRPEVRGGDQYTFEEIWGFLQESGFLYPEKLKHLDKEEIGQSMEKLLGSPNDLFKTWVVTGDEKIAAHISAFRLYRNTWAVQHLAASSVNDGVARARLLNLALAEYCEQHRGIEWVRVCYRPSNKWPARVFGTFAQRMVNLELSDFRTMAYMVAPAERLPASASSGEYRVRDYAPTDLAAIEAHFIANKRMILLRSADINKESIKLREIDNAYREMGLHRSREVLVAERNGRICGFALAEISSPGLNFSELTNTATLYVWDEDPQVVSILARAVSDRYHRAGRRECIILAEDETVPLLLDLGYDRRKEYSCWTWHRSLWRQFYEYALSHFG